MELRVHDLVRIQSSADLECESAVPEWVCDALKRAPWVVIRRSPVKNGRIPVGVRGAGRTQRFAAYLPTRSVKEAVTPVQLAVQARWRGYSLGADSQAFSQLEEIADYYNRAGIRWGPTGSVGFELASGTGTVHPGSDIDLAIYLPQRVERKTVARWNTFNHQCSVKVDALLETPAGACSLSEFVRQEESTILLRTMNGPTLVKCPWTT
ncbi:malonate decarboxylase holo-ACP synthase [Paenibacillus allorhizosphaerae]|uniref:Phosphoribosyl-dephospho-CoA transferase n=1 Tax=Paenibacillus allorhizosphaerae TaxID=2849866 RepID=A0ABN7TW38_9BACL|nr:malonate decarboxylase holo-ACP synthase [Paenibacillus allorhizosphaerae]CAG7652668.1 Phosphoribosyl-dephospho-CoA transferase [Paenibacillus allorhizosphaerae]